MSAWNPRKIQKSWLTEPVDFLATRPHFADHLAPIWPYIENKGGFYVPQELVGYCREKNYPVTPLKPFGGHPLNVSPRWRRQATCVLRCW